MFRSLFAIVFAVLFCILSLPVLGILVLIGRKDVARRDRGAMKVIQWAFRVLIRIAGVRIDVKGLENIPDDQAVLYVGNHRSIFDIIMTYTYMKRPTGYVAKNTLEKIPVFSTWMRYIYCLFVDRSDLKSGMQMILDAIRQIKGGRSVFIFPEGTRNKQEKDLPLLEFHEGSFRPATKSGCPIIPVAICNSVQIWEAHLPWLHATHVIIEFCSPIDPGSFSKEEKKRLGAYTQKVISDTIRKNTALL